MGNFIQALSPEMQGVVSKIVSHKGLKKRTSMTDWSKHMSAGSKKINLMKNTQNKMYIKSVLSSEKIQQ